MDEFSSLNNKLIQEFYMGDILYIIPVEKDISEIKLYNVVGMMFEINSNQINYFIVDLMNISNFIELKYKDGSWDLMDEKVFVTKDIEKAKDFILLNFNYVEVNE